MHNTILFSIFLIFVGSAIISTAALWARQSLLIAYMSLGILTGPWCIGWITNANIITEIGDTGILFLLFLLGLHLDPQNLIESIKENLLIAITSSIFFIIVASGISYSLNFNIYDSIIIGIALMFSSTIISLKLIPNKLLHHSLLGETLISILLLQDLLAIIVLVAIKAISSSNGYGYEPYLITLAMPLTIFIAFIAEKYLLQNLLRKYGHLREYLLITAVAWCLGTAQLAEALGLSSEIGAFIGGIAIASDSRIALYLAECMKPLRDFFLVLFFFSIGATFNIKLAYQELNIVLIIVMLMTIIKPFIFHILCKKRLNKDKQSLELGFRIGQISEFSILVGNIALHNQLITAAAATVIQGSAMISFLISTYIVVTIYKTPIGIEIISDD